VKTRLRLLAREDYFDLEEKETAAFLAANFSDCALFTIAAALHAEMGQDQQDLLYRIDRRALTWLAERDLDNLLTLTPEIKNYFFRRLYKLPN
jgi:hypothetical protein